MMYSRLESLFKPVIANAEQLADLGSSQQCEHANREVILRAPKSLHYGNSESLDFRVKATAAFINEDTISHRFNQLLGFFFMFMFVYILYLQIVTLIFFGFVCLTKPRFYFSTVY